MDCLGFVEVIGLVTAIEAADAGLKAANVELVGKDNVGAGLVSVIFKGEIGSVKTAVDAGISAATRIGKVVSSSVIARPSEEINVISSKPTL